MLELPDTVNVPAFRPKSVDFISIPLLPTLINLLSAIDPPLINTSPEELTKNPLLVFDTVVLSVKVPRLINPVELLPDIVNCPVDRLNSEDFMSNKLLDCLINSFVPACKLNSPEPDKNIPLPVIPAAEPIFKSSPPAEPEDCNLILLLSK